MAKAKQKTTETESSVNDFINAVEESRQKDCKAIVDVMESVSGFKAKMWGPSIIGFGSYHYKYESGHEGDAPLVAFSPRKNEFSLYIANFDGKEELLTKLGKHKSAKACVYIKKLEDIDISVLKKLITGSIKHYQTKY